MEKCEALKFLISRDYRKYENGATTRCEKLLRSSNSDIVTSLTGVVSSA
jgi:hypothetical protein